MSTPTVDPSKVAEFDRLIKERDYYRLLSVTRSCTPEELKKSYRKMALRLHPDRNLGIEEDATVLFAKVQAAYDILSDPQERAYYDQYGSRRGPGGFNTGYDDEEEDDSPGARFTPTEQVREWVKQTEQYQGAAPGGEPKFYKAAGELFKKLAQEERDAELKFDPLWEPYPSRFGTSKSSYEDDDLAGFYNRWTSFTTRKSFSWFDKYDVRYAEDRRTRRAMDAANNRVRESEKRKFNEAVRSFARFIKKNDPRFKKYNAAKMAANGNGSGATGDKGKKTAKELSEEHRKRNAQERSQYQEQDWERISGDEYEEFYDSDLEKDSKRGKSGNGGNSKKTCAKENQDDNRSESEDGDQDFVTRESSSNKQEGKASQGASDDDDVLHVFECVVCDKTFKTQKQLVAHERSKKHIKALEQLREEMLKEGIELGLDNDNYKNGTSNGKKDDTKVDKDEPKQDSKRESEQDAEEEEEEDYSDDDEYANTKQSSGFGALMDSDESESSDDDEPQTKSSGFSALMDDSSDESEDEDDDEYEKPKSSGFGALMDDSSDENEESEESENENEEKNDSSAFKPEQKATKPDISELLAQMEKSRISGEQSTKSSNNNNNIASNESNGNTTPTKKVGKAKQRRLKKKGGESNLSAELNCNVCKQEFSSKNKLFEHIRHTGHAAAPRF